MVVNSLGIIGYGRFGKLLAEILSKDFQVMAYDTNLPTGYSLEKVASADAIFLCIPIIELEATAKQLATLVRPGTIILDVCSVKLYPESVLKKYFQSDYVLPTHPMFGPDAAKKGLENLPIVLCPTENTKKEIIKYWSNIFSSHKLKVEIMTCDDHDKNTAYSLCVTQFVGRALGELNLKPSEIDTENFRNLLTIRDMALNDSYQLFEGLQKLNPYAKKMRQQFNDAVVSLCNKLKSA